MAIYAIGDIQGCLDPLLTLLDRLNFDPTADRLWFAGDLVNRGPQSLDTLRLVYELRDSALTVLGNHDLHLLAAAYHPVRHHRRDTLQAILEAPDREQLLHWLRQQPLLHHDAALGYTLVHAGLPPQWDLATAQTCAKEVEDMLQGPDFKGFLARMYGDRPDTWSDALSSWDRLRFITNAFTRLRFCDAQGRLDLNEKGPPGTQSAPFMPWFEVPGRASAGLNILFGHWSTLGERSDAGIFPLDSGCLWGGQLSALRLDGEPRWTRLHCPEFRHPKKSKKHAPA